MTQRAAPPTAPPDRIGPYQVLERLGEGGMGTVYLAEQREPVWRRVALKVIKLGMDTKAVLARFDAERQALSMMEHSCVARIYDAGMTEEGRPYFAMEYVKGIPITEYCDQNKLGLKERIELFRRVCSGVQHAHLKGVMHRDLKPSNVLVTLQEGAPTPKIIDFGLAKAVDHRLVAATLFTQHGQLIGTPEYMSPEQAGLGGLDIDTRTDVYSLGVLLYELLTGELPFSRQELARAGYLEIQRILMETDPIKPSTKITTLGDDATVFARARGIDVRELKRRLRGDLDWIVMKSLERDRTRRYQTTLELAADLERHLGNTPVIASPPRVGYRLKKFVRRYRVQCAAAAAVLVAILGAICMVIWVKYQRAEDAGKHTAQMEKLAAERRMVALLMSVEQLRLAKAKAETLYPPFPERVRAMQGWLSEFSEPLRERLSEIEDVLTELRGRGRPSTPRELNEEPEVDTRFPAYTFENNTDLVLYQTLNRLLLDLKEFVGETGTVAAVKRRIEEAVSVGKSLEDKATEWAQAIDSIARSEVYRHLVLKPQVGLVPIGMDKDSKLWEFAHLTSGEPAMRLPRDGRARVIEDTGIVFVLLPAGEFKMGTQRAEDNENAHLLTDESPVRDLKIDAFFMSKYEMTRSQWKRLSGTDRPVWNRDGQSQLASLLNLKSAHPATQVDWDGCDLILRRSGLALPTEAQWEYACRAHSTTRWSSGDEAGDLHGCANVLDQIAERLRPDWGRQEGDFNDNFVVVAPVGWLRANAFGLHDMHGNVAEWCRDWFLPYKNGVRTGDGLRLGAASGMRVARGGSFSTPASTARSAYRGVYLPSIQADDIGVRPSRAITP